MFLGVLFGAFVALLPVAWLAGRLARRGRPGALSASFGSPGGRFGVCSSPMEVRMSHWIERPIVVDLGSSRTLLDLGSTQ